MTLISSKCDYLFVLQVELRLHALVEQEERVEDNAHHHAVLQAPKYTGEHCYQERKHVAFCQEFVFNITRVAEAAVYSLFARHISPIVSYSTIKNMAAMMMAAKVALGM